MNRRLLFSARFLLVAGAALSWTHVSSAQVLSTGSTCCVSAATPTVVTYPVVSAVNSCYVPRPVVRSVNYCPTTTVVSQPRVTAYLSQPTVVAAPVASPSACGVPCAGAVSAPTVGRMVCQMSTTTALGGVSKFVPPQTVTCCSIMTETTGGGPSDDEDQPTLAKPPVILEYDKERKELPDTARRDDRSQFAQVSYRRDPAPAASKSAAPQPKSDPDRWDDSGWRSIR